MGGLDSIVFMTIKLSRCKYLSKIYPFIKCIFSKEYRSAIVDFKDYQKEFGNGYVMDHSYELVFKSLTKKLQNEIVIQKK